MNVIGVGHYSRVGKDSFANYLLSALDAKGAKLVNGELIRGEDAIVAKKMPFAWKLKDIAYQLYAWDGLRPAEFYETPEGEKYRDIKLPTIGKTPVEIWIDLGTPAVRDQVYERTWIDYVLRTDHKADVLVIPDLRFPNEVAAVQSAGGIIIKVVRPGRGPRKSVADRALLGFTGWDYVIGASGEMSELKDWADQFAAWYAGTGMKPTQSAAERQHANSVESIEPWPADVVPLEQKLKLFPDAVKPVTQPVTGRIGDHVCTYLPPAATLDDSVTRSMQGNG